MANAFEVGHQRTQTRTHKTRADHRFIDRREMRFLTAGAVAGHAAMLGDLDRACDDFDLLNDPRQFVNGLDASAAIRAERQVVVTRLVDLIGRKGRSLVTRVAWLRSLLALAFSLGGRLWRFDNITGRWFG